MHIGSSQKNAALEVNSLKWWLGVIFVVHESQATTTVKGDAQTSFFFFGWSETEFLGTMATNVPILPVTVLLVE